MRIALVGYGKMGKAIEAIALEKGHEVVLKIDLDNQDQLDAQHLRSAEVAIEFTGPHSAFENVTACLRAGIPTVCGSTGWLEHWQEARDLCESLKGSLLYASNFSIGVNIFFELNKRLAELMAPHREYEVSMTEIHHTQKRDAPSGTAISLAEQLLERLPEKKGWVNHTSADKAELEIISKRIDPAPGTHQVLYSSAVDDIEITHTAHNRTGFAGGAVLAAEFLKGKTGIFTMQDVLGF